MKTISYLTLRFGFEDAQNSRLVKVHETAWSNGLRLIHGSVVSVLRFRFMNCRSPSVDGFSIVCVRLHYRVVRRLRATTEY